MRRHGRVCRGKRPRQEYKLANAKAVSAAARMAVAVANLPELSERPEGGLGARLVALARAEMACYARSIFRAAACAACRAAAAGERNNAGRRCRGRQRIYTAYASAVRHEGTNGTREAGDACSAASRRYKCAMKAAVVQARFMSSAALLRPVSNMSNVQEFERWSPCCQQTRLGAMLERCRVWGVGSWRLFVQTCMCVGCRKWCASNQTKVRGAGCGRLAVEARKRGQSARAQSVGGGDSASENAWGMVKQAVEKRSWRANRPNCHPVA